MYECGGIESQLGGKPDKAEYPIYKVITDRKTRRQTEVCTHRLH